MITLKFLLAGGGGGKECEHHRRKNRMKIVCRMPGRRKRAGHIPQDFLDKVALRGVIRGKGEGGKRVRPFSMLVPKEKGSCPFFSPAMYEEVGLQYRRDAPTWGGDVKQPFLFQPRGKAVCGCSIAAGPKQEASRHGCLHAREFVELGEKKREFLGLFPRRGKGRPDQ